MRKAGRFSELPCPLASQSFSLYVYAAQFSDGVVKVGVTWNPRFRMQQLRTKYGKEISRVGYAGIERRRNGFSTEKLALSTCRRVAAKTVGKEWFHGIHFGEAVTAIRSAAGKAAA